MIGEILEHYRIIELVGRGGMGAVYRAVDINLDRTVAIKVLNADLQNDAEFVERFRHEVRIQAALNHPNIATLFNFFLHKGSPVAVMEFIEGETLQAMIQRRGPVPAHISLPIFKQALQGVAAGHRRNIVHRDLKPANLMITHEGVVKVTDFGIAKLQNSTGLTQMSTRIGSSFYMAPEQILGRNVDARTDIYAMGITLYELLSGQTPFRATTQYAIETAHVNEMPPPPTEHYPHIPPAAVDAVMRALAKDPAQRFAKAEDFMQALPELNGQPYIGPVQPKKPPAPPVVITPPAPQPAIQQPIAKQPVAGQPNASQPGATPPQPGPTRLTDPPKKDSPPVVNPELRKKQLWIGGGAIAAVLAVTAVVKLVQGSDAPPRGPSLAGNTTNGLTLLGGATRNDQSPQIPSHTLDPSPQSPGSSDDATDPPAESPDSSTRTAPSEPGTNDPGPGAPTPTPTRPAAARDLSGVWTAVYTDASGQSRPQVVSLEINQVDGAGNAGTLKYNGILQYQTDSGSRDECRLDGSTYTVGNRQLELLVHCRNPQHPKYFNFPLDFSGVDPRANLLSGGHLKFLQNGISVILKRTS